MGQKRGTAMVASQLGSSEVPVFLLIPSPVPTTSNLKLPTRAGAVAPRSQQRHFRQFEGGGSLLSGPQTLRYARARCRGSLPRAATTQRVRPPMAVNLPLPLPAGPVALQVAVLLSCGLCHQKLITSTPMQAGGRHVLPLRRQNSPLGVACAAASWGRRRRPTPSARGLRRPTLTPHWRR